MIFNRYIKVKIAVKGLVIAELKFRVMPCVGDVFYHPELNFYYEIKSVRHVCRTRFITRFTPTIEVERHDKETKHVY